jgi:intracellular septation protein A
MAMPDAELTAAPGAAGLRTVKHWRQFGAQEWGYVRDGLRGLVLGTLLPVAFFYVSYRTWSFTVAVLVVLAWSAGVFVWHRRVEHRFDVFSATTFVFACVKAGAGLISNDPFLYLAWPSIENLIYGGVFFGSALLGAPLLAMYARRIYPVPHQVQASATFRRAFIVVSAVWLAGFLLRASLRLVFLTQLSLEPFLVVDTIVGWPINLAMVSFTVWYPLRTLGRAGLIEPEAVP